MTYEDAQEWLKGNRTWINFIKSDESGNWCKIVAEADAACTQQAYWIVKAHKEGLIE